jgi:hypothetical protein
MRSTRAGHVGHSLPTSTASLNGALGVDTVARGTSINAELGPGADTVLGPDVVFDGGISTEGDKVFAPLMRERIECPGAISGPILSE